MNAQEMKLLLPPDLGITPEEFASFWNASPEFSTVALADTERERGFGVDSVNEVLVVLGDIAVGVASSAIYDLIVRAFARRKLPVKIKTEEEGSTRVIVVSRITSSNDR